MTATTTEHSMTKVLCLLCRNEFAITLHALRALVDHGGAPHCGCTPQPVKAITARAKAAAGLAGRPARSKAELILLATRRLEEAHGRAPTVAAIVVAAWQATPEAFGLAGYATTHPDSNRVIAELVKMVKHGLLSRPEEKHYALTDAGLKLAGGLLPAGAV